MRKWIGNWPKCARRTFSGTVLLPMHPVALEGNMILGMPPPDHRQIKAKFGERFPERSEWKSPVPLPSGLLRPTRIHVDNS